MGNCCSICATRRKKPKVQQWTCDTMPITLESNHPESVGAAQLNNNFASTPNDPAFIRAMTHGGNGNANSVILNGGTIASDVPSSATVLTAPLLADALGAGRSSLDGNGLSGVMRDAIKTNMSSMNIVTSQNNASRGMTNIVPGSTLPMMGGISDVATRGNNSNNYNTLTAGVRESLPKSYGASYNSTSRVAGSGSSTSATAMYDMTQATINQLAAPRSPLQHTPLFSEDYDRRLGIRPGRDKYANLAPVAKDHSERLPQPEPYYPESPQELHSFGGDSTTTASGEDNSNFEMENSESDTMQSAQPSSASNSSSALNNPPRRRSEEHNQSKDSMSLRMKMLSSSSSHPAHQQQMAQRRSRQRYFARSDLLHHSHPQDLFVNRDGTTMNSISDNNANNSLGWDSINEGSTMSILETESSAFATPMEKDSSSRSSSMAHTTTAYSSQVTSTAAATSSYVESRHSSSSPSTAGPTGHRRYASDSTRVDRHSGRTENRQRHANGSIVHHKNMSNNTNNRSSGGDDGATVLPGAVNMTDASLTKLQSSAAAAAAQRVTADAGCVNVSSSSDVDFSPPPPGRSWSNALPAPISIPTAMAAGAPLSRRDSHSSMITVTHVHKNTVQPMRAMQTPLSRQASSESSIRSYNRMTMTAAAAGDAGRGGRFARTLSGRSNHSGSGAPRSTTQGSTYKNNTGSNTSTNTSTAIYDNNNKSMHNTSSSHSHNNNSNGEYDYDDAESSVFQSCCSAAGSVRSIVSSSSDNLSIVTHVSRGTHSTSPSGWGGKPGLRVGQGLVSATLPPLSLYPNTRHAGPPVGHGSDTAPKTANKECARRELAVSSRVWGDAATPSAMLSARTAHTRDGSFCSCCSFGLVTPPLVPVEPIQSSANSADMYHDGNAGTANDTSDAAATDCIAANNEEESTACEVASVPARALSERAIDSAYEDLVKDDVSVGLPINTDAVCEEQSVLIPDRCNGNNNNNNNSRSSRNSMPISADDARAEEAAAAAVRNHNSSATITNDSAAGSPLLLPSLEEAVIAAGEGESLLMQQQHTPSLSPQEEHWVREAAAAAAALRLLAEDVYVQPNDFPPRLDDTDSTNNYAVDGNEVQGAGDITGVEQHISPAYSIPLSTATVCPATSFASPSHIPSAAAPVATAAATALTPMISMPQLLNSHPAPPHNLDSSTPNHGASAATGMHSQRGAARTTYRDRQARPVAAARRTNMTKSSSSTSTALLHTQHTSPASSSQMSLSSSSTRMGAKATIRRSALQLPSLDELAAMARQQPRGRGLGVRERRIGARAEHIRHDHKNNDDDTGSSTHPVDGSHMRSNSTAVAGNADDGSSPSSGGNSLCTRRRSGSGVLSSFTATSPDQSANVPPSALASPQSNLISHRRSVVHSVHAAVYGATRANSNANPTRNTPMVFNASVSPPVTAAAAAAATAPMLRYGLRRGVLPTGSVRRGGGAAPRLSTFSINGTTRSTSTSSSPRPVALCAKSQQHRPQPQPDVLEASGASMARRTNGVAGKRASRMRSASPVPSTDALIREVAAASASGLARLQSRQPSRS